MKMISTAAKVRTIKLGAKVKTLVSDQVKDSEERRKLYHTARWLKMRATFLAEHPLCVECQRAGKFVPANVVDHKHGHRRHNWRDQFWNTDGWRALCIPCHNATAGAELGEWRRADGSGG